jgi:hypothetical protein
VEKERINYIHILLSKISLAGDLPYKTTQEMTELTNTDDKAIPSFYSSDQHKILPHPEHHTLTFCSHTVYEYLNSGTAEG